MTTVMPSTMSKPQIWALRTAGVLWVVWGLVHVLAGVMTMSLATAAAVGGIADPAQLTELQYHPAAGGVISQHGWNLAWIGATTIVGGVFVWRGRLTAIWLSALVGGMADLGYFIFLDLPGHVNFVPGTVMTLVSSAAIILSAWAWLSMRGASRTPSPAS